MTIDKLPPLNERILSEVRALYAEPDVARALDVAREEAPFAVEEQISLCEIPAPTFEEEARALEVEKRLRAYGLTDVWRDEIGNVIGRRPGTGEGPVLALVAHLDTVFPAGTDCTVKREGDTLRAPGIGDNASGLRSLLQILRCLTAGNIETRGDILFVADVQEEGNGDLNGAKALCNGSVHLDGLLALDGSDVGRVQKGATGSHSWRFIVEGPGGHSWGAFGAVPSATHAVARATAEIADFEVPSDPRTSFTVGMITGGTSVTTIAPRCEAEVDFRSLSNDELLKIEKRIFRAFEKAVDAENARWGMTAPEKMLRLSKVLIGDIPGGLPPDDCPVIQTARAAQRCLGIELTNYQCSSTDANPAMSLGIPATCLSSGGIGIGAHSLGETFIVKDIHLGPQLALLTTLALVGTKTRAPLLPQRKSAS